ERVHVGGREVAAGHGGGDAGGAADLDGAARVVAGGCEVLRPHGGEARPRQRGGRRRAITDALGQGEPSLALAPALVEVADEEGIRRLRLVEGHAGGGRQRVAEAIGHGQRL